MEASDGTTHAVVPSASLSGSWGVAVDRANNIIVADTYSHVIRIVSGGIISIAAGAPGYCAFGGDGGPATSAWLCMPLAVTVDSRNNIFIADGSNNRIRLVNASDGIISTIAGNGNMGFGGDGGLAINAILFHPRDVIIDRNGNVIIADT